MGYTDSRASGSSPLTRGKRCDIFCIFLCLGLIPAHAGKTPCLPSRPSPPRAHPRSRGENTRSWSDVTTLAGSSPLTRGKPFRKRRTCLLVGLIPAHAGKTIGCASTAAHTRAHPRSRGENGEAGAVIGADLGSSPLTRGKPPPRDRGRGLGGLIPAHAGKTALVGGRSEDAKAHPRSRGENVACLDARHDRGRLIPAHAGKTRSKASPVRSKAAHPRSRGENPGFLRRCSDGVGSSPLTRGKHRPRQAGHARDGLIPAHAGKTRTVVPR